MVGLSIVLEEEVEEALPAEPHRRRRSREVISKINNMSMLITTGGSSSSTPTSPSPAFRPAFPVADFLDQCFLCRTKLSPGKDIYMYRGDRAFCSEECRCRQILLDEEEAFRMENQNQSSSHCSSSTHPPSSRNKRSGRNRATGGV